MDIFADDLQLSGSVSLSESQIETIVASIPSDVERLMEQAGPRIVLAGGFIRDVLEHDPVNDLDLFVKDEAEAQNYATQLGGTISTITKTERALTVILKKGDLPWQLVYAWGNKSPIDIIQQFDFTCCQAAIWYEDGKWHSVTGFNFGKHRECRQLCYTFPSGNNPFGSLMRAFRFVSKGYSIDSETVSGIVAECATQFAPDADLGETLQFMKSKFPKTRIY